VLASDTFGWADQIPALIHDADVSDGSVPAPQLAAVAGGDGEGEPQRPRTPAWPRWVAAEPGSSRSAA
jgi:hypothetical protein